MADRPHRTEPLPALIFSSRWLQLPLYLGLMVAQIAADRSAADSEDLLSAKAPQE